MGPSFPLDLTEVAVTRPEVPLQYPSLSTLLFRNNIVSWIVSELGYSAPGPDLTLEERRSNGANLDRILEGEKEAARAPPSHV